MTEQSLIGRLSGKALPFLSKQVFPTEWLDAGDDRSRLGDVAAKRRRTNGPRPDAILERSWARATTQVDGRSLHLFTPSAGGASDLVLFYCHGGAFVVGPSSLEWLFAAKLAKAIGCDLAIYDYAKVPEHDSVATRAGTLEAYDVIAARYPKGCLLAGTSAGGNLAASTALHLKQNGARLPHAVALFSPWLDLTVAHPDAPALAASDLLLPIDILRRDGELYAGDLDATNPLLSPRFAAAEDLAGMPPTVITAGAAEILLPEAEEFVVKLVTAGVDATLHVEPFGQHVGVMATTPEGGAIFAEVVDRLSPVVKAAS